jgi:hypothetical protein
MDVRAFRRGTFAALAAIGASLPLTAARAGDIADKAAEAESLLSAGKPQEALAAFDQATGDFWEASPLQVRVATFVDSVAGFGDYHTLAEASFKPTDTVKIYLEPIGYGFAQEGDSFRATLAADLEVKTPGGIIFGKAADFARLSWVSKEKLRQVHATIASPLPALKPGDYVLTLTLRDLNSPKTATVDLPFEVVAP